MTSSAVHPFLMDVLRGTEPGALLAPAPRDGEWGRIIEEAAVQGLAPLLYRRLKGRALDGRVPGAILERLEAQVFGQAAWNMILASELGSILREFEARGLPSAPLRGFALAERLYGDGLARPMGDVDLLVRKDDVPAVATILGAMGFREIDRRPGFALAFSYTLEFFKERQGWVMIEPHWTLAYPPFVDRIDMNEVWERCVRGRVVGVETWLLGREELLLHLCLHLAHRDGTAPLLWFYELDRLVQLERQVLDWSRVLSLARGAGVQFLISEVLGRVRTLFGTPVPDPVLGQVTQERARSAEGRLARLLGGASGVDGKESLAVLFTLKGFRATLRYALALLFPSPEFMLLKYGLTRRSQLGFAYVRRFCRFSWEALKGIAKLLGCPRTIN